MHHFVKVKNDSSPPHKKISVYEAYVLNYRIKFAYYFRVLQPWQFSFVGPDRHACHIYTSINKIITWRDKSYFY